MIHLLAALLTISTFSTNDSTCSIQVPSGNEITVADIPKYNRLGDLEYARQRDGVVLTDHGKEYFLNEFLPYFDSIKINIADRFFDVEAGNALIHFYHRKLRTIPQWFAVVVPSNCDCKWMFYLRRRDIAGFRKTIGRVSFFRKN